MATFAFKPYTYVPTAPRSKSTATRRKPAPEQDPILTKLQHVMSSVETSTPRPSAANDGGCRPGIRGTGTVYGSSDQANNNENDDDDDRDLPTVEELLRTELLAQGFTTGGRGPDKTSGAGKVAADESDGFVDRSRSAQSDNLGGSPEDPIVLLGDGDLSASEAEAEAEAKDVGLRAESVTAPGARLLDSPETAFDSKTPTAPPYSSDGWHDIDPDTPSSPLSSEPSHDIISTEGSRHARSEATTPSSSPPPRHYRVSIENQLSHDGGLYTGPGAADERGLVGPARNADPVDKRGRRQQQQDVQREEDEDNDKDASSKREHPRSLQGACVGKCRPLRANGAILGMEAIESPKAGAHLLDFEASSIASMQKAQQRLDPSPATSHDDAVYNSHSGESDKDGEEQRPIKRKRPSSHDGPIRKKRRRHPQRSSPRQRRTVSRPYGQYTMSRSPPPHISKRATGSGTKGRSPSPASSIPRSRDKTIPLDDFNRGRLSRDTPPTLTEITFRPHSAHCHSFTAVVRDGGNGQGVSFGQLARLVASIGHAGEIDDFTVKPAEEQHSYFVTGFSRHTLSSRSSCGRAALPTTAEAGCDYVEVKCARPQYGKALDTETLAAQGCKLSSSDDDCGLTDSDSDVGSDDDGCSSEAEKRGDLSVRMNIPWDPVDVQRLVVWRKEEKPWDWIFKKFPSRTHGAIRTRWHMTQSRK